MPRWGGRPERLLPAIVVVGAALRLVGLTSQSFWLDEYLWTEMASGSVTDILRAPDGYPPLFGLIVHAMTAVGLGSDWWLRLPSALAGVAAIPLVYAVGRRVADRTTALLAAAVVAVNPFAIWYSQECGAYALLMLVGLASTWCVLELLDDGGAAAAIGYALTLAVGFGLHYYFVFVVLAQASIAVLDVMRHRERRRLWAWTAVAALASFAVWGQALLWDLAEQSAMDRQRTMSLFALPYTVLTFVGGFSLGPPLRTLHRLQHLGGSTRAALQPYLWVVALAVGAPTALAVLGLTQPRTMRRALVGLLVAVPAMGIWVCSAMMVGYRPRYLLPSLPFAAIWLADAARARPRPLAVGLLALVVALELVAVARLDAPAYAREDVRAAAARVAERDDAAVVVFLGDAAGAYPRYARPRDREFWILPKDAAELTGESVLAQAIAAARGRSLWVVVARPYTVDPEGHVLENLDGQFPLVDEESFTGVTLREYVVPDNPGETSPES